MLRCVMRSLIWLTSSEKECASNSFKYSFFICFQRNEILQNKKEINYSSCEVVIVKSLENEDTYSDQENHSIYRIPTSTPNMWAGTFTFANKPKSLV